MPTTTQPAAAKIEVGTRVYNRGDMCNQAHFCTVTKIETDRFATTATLSPDEGSDRSGPYQIPVHMINHVDKGHGGTRFVTEAAYRAFYAARAAQ